MPHSQEIASRKLRLALGPERSRAIMMIMGPETITTSTGGKVGIAKG